MNVPNCFGVQPFGLTLAFDAVYPSALQKFPVEFLQIQRGQATEWDIADVRLDVVVDITPIGQVG